ncbi:serine/threonine protein kinase [Sorangium sp. So ce388]|uniref:serine/threonine protein kinase n=1 Tax=Sorangium sp. So ce388 TaxID=3133309 RepID=UPI003F5C2AF6
MVGPGDFWEGHRILGVVRDGMVRTVLARQLGDTDETVWLHLREPGPIDRAAFAAEVQRVQAIARAVPQLEPVLYGDVSGSVAWVATRRRGPAVPFTEAQRGAGLGAAALETVIALAEVIARCHAQGWVHGSLSSERVLIAADRSLLITHFGLVRLLRLGASDAAREPLVAAPELLSGAKVGPRADVYGLGAVLYELVCGHELHEGQARAPGGRCPRLTFPDGTPRAVRAAIELALAEDPRHRYASVELLSAVLKGLVQAWPRLDRAPPSQDAAMAAVTSEPPTLRSAQQERLRALEDAPEAPDAPPCPSGGSSSSGHAMDREPEGPSTQPSGASPAKDEEEEPTVPELSSLEVPARPAPARMPDSRRPALPALYLEDAPDRGVSLSSAVCSTGARAGVRIAIAVSALALAVSCLTVAGLSHRAPVVSVAGKLPIVTARPASACRAVGESPAGDMGVNPARVTPRGVSGPRRTATLSRNEETPRFTPKRPFCERGDASCGDDEMY